MLLGVAQCRPPLQAGDRFVAQRAIRRASLPELEPRISGELALTCYAIEQIKRGEEAARGIDVPYYRGHLAKVLSAGYTKRFRALTLRMSFFSILHVGRLAANDFLRNPTTMMATYLELSSAVEALAHSGQLSKSASVRAINFAEALELARAAGHTSNRSNDGPACSHPAQRFATIVE